MKKLTIATITAGALLLSACTADNDEKNSDSTSNDPDIVVESKIGDISKEEFYNEMKEYFGENTLYNMVVLNVLEDKYEVSDEEVDTAVQEVKDEQGDMFSLWLMQNRFADEEAFRKQTYERLLQEKLMFEDVEISDDEVKEKFDEMKENKQIAIRASHILISKDDEDFDAKVAKVQKKLDEGADFAELAKEYSSDGSAENGGDLGYFATGKMVKPFEDAAFALGEGEVSGPVESEFGTHFIKVTDIPTFEDEESKIRKELASEKVDFAAVQEKLNKLIEDADIDIKIDEFKDLFTQPEAQG